MQLPWQLKSSGIRYLVQRYAYDARLEAVKPHTLRHTFGKNLVDAGVSLDRVASLLGHESVDTTRIHHALRAGPAAGGGEDRADLDGDRRGAARNHFSLEPKDDWHLASHLRQAAF
jgi:integrase